MKEGHIIFTIPRSMILSTQTCVLPQNFGLDAWKKYGLHQGWAGLILCMMWEAAQGSQSKWSAYLGRWDPYKKKKPILADLSCPPFKDILPKSFDTPIFWGEDDLSELKGTCVVGWFLPFFFFSTSHPHHTLSIFMKLTQN